MKYLSPKIIDLLIVCDQSCDPQHVLNLVATTAAVLEAHFHDYAAVVVEALVLVVEVCVDLKLFSPRQYFKFKIETERQHVLTCDLGCG